MATLMFQFPGRALLTAAVDALRVARQVDEQSSLARCLSERAISGKKCAQSREGRWSVSERFVLMLPWRQVLVERVRDVWNRAGRANQCSPRLEAWLKCSISLPGALKRCDKSFSDAELLLIQQSVLAEASAESLKRGASARGQVIVVEEHAPFVRADGGLRSSHRVLRSRGQSLHAGYPGTLISPAHTASGFL